MFWSASSRRTARRPRDHACMCINHGVGECGVFTYEVAETKVTQVMDLAASTSIRCNA
jgi:ATP-dependent Clp protease adapter protein ClpS